MPRQQSSQTRSSSSSSRTYVPPPKIWYATPPPAPIPSLPAPLHATQPTVWQSMKQGFGLGAGSEVGHRVIGSFLGPSATQQQMIDSMKSQQIPTAPYYASENYTQCLEVNKERPEVCKPFLSKEKSPWTHCMEMNYYRSDLCSGDSKPSK